MTVAVQVGEIVAYGEIPCKVCGDVHHCRATGKPHKDSVSWASESDGHAYHPYSWEAVGRTLLANHAMPTADDLRPNKLWKP